MIVNRKFAKKLQIMIGLLKEKNEIEKLQEEYKRLAETAFNVDADSKNEIPEQELTLEECESWYDKFIMPFKTICIQKRDFGNRILFCLYNGFKSP